MCRILIRIATITAGVVLCSIAGAHEVRPAYLQIEETAPNTFDVLWKQPRNGALAPNFAPTVSNGLLDVPPGRQYSGADFVLRERKERRIERAAFEGATLRIAGLESSISDVLINIRFAT